MTEPTNGQESTTAEGAAPSPSSSKRGLIIAVIVLVMVIIVAAIAYNALASSTSAKQVTQTAQTPQGANEDESTPAPDFAMTTVDGEELTLSSFQGKPVVLNFWASTCGPCQREMPEFQSAYEQFGDEVSFVMLNVPDFNGETRERALALIEESGYTFPVYFPVGDDASIEYGITSIPRTYFITAEGSMEVYASGSIDGETLARGIAMILD